MSLLSVQHINTGYEKKQVLFDLSLDVAQGETVILVGSNGSGKSTFFKVVFRQLPLWEFGNKGIIVFNGINITTATSHCLIQKGLMYIPQKNELFEDMTVSENLKMSVLHLNNKRETQKRLDEVYEQMPILENNQKKTSTRLSGGERKLLTLGMALMNRPKLLLYDEPLAGLSGNNVALVLQWIKTLQARGTTLVIIEHRIKELMQISNKIIGLKLGYLHTANLSNLTLIKSFMV